MAVQISGPGVTVGLDITDTRSSVAGALKGSGSRHYGPAQYGWTIASGVTAGSADTIWGNAATIASNTTTGHDLATAGTLTDEFGAPVVFAKLRGIVLCANGTAGVANTTLLSIARHASAGVVIFSAVSAAIAPLSAGGVYVWLDPNAGATVTAVTADIINVINTAGATAGYDIFFIGTSS